MEDDKIIDLFFERSEKAIIELSSKYNTICMKTALNIIGNFEDSEECVNDAYLGIWESIPPHRPNPLLAFLLRLVKNISINRYKYIRAEKRMGNYQECIDEYEWALSTNETPEDTYIVSEVSKYIDDFIDTMNKRNRLIFVRRYWYMDSYSDIAQITGMQEGAVRTRLSRQRKQLKQYLMERGVEI